MLLFSSQVRHRWVSKYPNGKFKASKTHISCAYSQADLAKFPTRKGFGKCIKKHFNSGSGKVKVQYWTCAKQKHQNGGVHYHVALKFTGPKRWKSVQESISLKEGVVVTFWDNYDNYYSAHRYICKDDDSVHQNKHHPNLDEVASPRTKKSTQAYRQARKSYAQENRTDAPQKKKQKATSRKRLTQFEVSEFLLKKTRYIVTLSFFMKQTKEKRKHRQIWQPLCCSGPANLSVISLRTLGE